MVYLITYAFACEIWAPWSEDLGRKSTLHLSLFLVNIWQLPVVFAPNIASVMVGRALGGLSAVEGSVTLGVMADMWEPGDQQYAVAYVVLGSVGGSALGPIFGGAIQQYMSWQWTIYFQLIAGFTVQPLHLFLVPETRTTIMIDQIAKQRRRLDPKLNIWGPSEMIPFRLRFSAKQIFYTWMRPFKMFFTEPNILALSLLSGFSDALIFMFLQCFNLVYAQWGFDITQRGFAFIPIGIGYLLAYLLFIPSIRRNTAMRLKHTR
jgi:predicted MFS family arabinose efflux permease